MDKQDNNTSQNKTTNESKIYNLKDIYNKSFDGRYPNTPIFVEEKSTNVDLLKRDEIIDKLYNAIYYSKSNSSFTIGLNGEWGSGKTTLINIVKNKLRKNNPNEFNVIDSEDFDPWMF